MTHDPSAVALAALVLNVSLMRHLAARGLLEDDLKPVFNDVADSLKGHPSEVAVIAVLSEMVSQPQD
ncbi:hypothetical protein [Roseomonas sp. BN140053]|uniref:hypothetical protein n=1 Tax=Roseomonas sp. BN140053 TaxID=3391898 RepID=UPI0039EC8062